MYNGRSLQVKLVFCAFHYFFFKYLKFLAKSGNEHSIHSPFVFDFYCKVLISKKQYYSFIDIEGLRNRILKDHRIISVNDYGAGSVGGEETKKQVSDILKHSSKSPHLAQILFKISTYFSSKTILDLGTSLGISTIYLAKSNRKATIYSLEGCPNHLKIAAENFVHLHVNNIKTIQGNIDNTLEKIVSEIRPVDLVFFDANHRYKPTMKYFSWCLQAHHEDSVFIFDDIYWSSGMGKAWKEIKNHPDVTLTIDCFFLGIVFFRKAQPKQHFKLRL